MPSHKCPASPCSAYEECTLAREPQVLTKQPDVLIVHKQKRLDDEVRANAVVLYKQIPGSRKHMPKLKCCTIDTKNLF